MKIKQIGKHNGDIIETVLNNRNIENRDLFLNPTDANDLNPFDLFNMQEAVNCVIAHLSVGSSIGILVDPDADGFTSSSILHGYLKSLEPNANIKYFLHDSKSHGLTDKIVTQICETDLDLLIVPDAGTNDTEQINKLFYMQIDVIILDHHEIERYPDGCILVNNQYKYNNNTNPNLTGAGLTLRFCEAVDTMFGLKRAEDFYDLAAIGQIGDASDISENEVRNMVFKGLKNLNNNFIITALKNYFEDIHDIAPKNLSFSVIPLINSVVRVGTMEEKELMFRAMNDYDTDKIFEVVKKKKNKDTGKFDKITMKWNIYEYALDILLKVKTRQANLVKKSMEKLESSTVNVGGIVIGILDTSEIGSVTGLIANKLATKHNKPALVFIKVEDRENTKENEEMKYRYAGSGRGYEKVLENLKEWCQNTELVEFAQGHANAFGIAIPEENYEKFIEATKTVIAREFVHEVDLHSEKNVDKNLIMEVDKYKHLFGGKVKDPLFAFTDINVNKQFIRKRGSVLTFFEKGVEFISFNTPEEIYDEMSQNFERYINCDFVGTASISNWNGKKTAQIVISDFEWRLPEKPKTVTKENLVF